MIIISNEYLSVAVSRKGAELQNIQSAGGNEYLWQGSQLNAWQGRAPVLFPVIGSYEQGFFYKGQETKMHIHGFAAISDFILEKQTENTCTFLLKSDDQSRQCYPCEWEFRVTYSLNCNTLNVTYSVRNVGKETMHFAAGHHGGYLLDGEKSNWKICFENAEKECEVYAQDAEVVATVKELLQREAILPVDEGLYDHGCVMVTRMTSRYVVLCNEFLQKKIKVDMGDFSYLTFWHGANARYLCIEPWSCKSSHFDKSVSFEKQEGVICLEAGSETKLSFSITV